MQEKLEKLSFYGKNENENKFCHNEYCAFGWPLKRRESLPKYPQRLNFFLKSVLLCSLVSGWVMCVMTLVEL